VKVDLTKMREYAKAVCSATEAYLGSLTDDDLSRPISLAALGLGESTVGYVLTNGLLGHAFSHTGEISCSKGLQGKRAIPLKRQRAAWSPLKQGDFKVEYLDYIRKANDTKNVQ
jgi:hypothetical protein